MFTTHSFILTFILGSNITPVTAYLIMIAELMSNTWDFLKIIKLHQQDSVISKQQKTEVQYHYQLQPMYEHFFSFIFSNNVRWVNTDCVDNVFVTTYLYFRIFQDHFLLSGAMGFQFNYEELVRRF